MFRFKPHYCAGAYEFPIHSVERTWGIYRSISLDLTQYKDASACDYIFIFEAIEFVINL